MYYLTILGHTVYPNEHVCMIIFSAFADSEGKLSSPKGSHLVHMALMMHSWVVPSQMFAQKLLTLYPQLSHGFNSSVSLVLCLESHDQVL